MALMASPNQVQKQHQTSVKKRIGIRQELIQMSGIRVCKQPNSNQTYLTTTVLPESASF
jgi:hypothetical protein